ncbi:DegT/DnrJ/EryC1/StrS family aminotransferase [Candidatus Peregrinibacteria bacterium]|nr:DegT/DnrJ/EryC1/StrS family aminotransferase [Candidatus Peregrinibacteria bacterium]
MINISKPVLDDAEVNAVIGVLRSGMLAQGEKVKELEKRVADFCRVKHAVAVNSGTAALHTALYSMDINSGDEVITSPFTFVASANSILMQGGKVVFADVSENDSNIDPNCIEKKITKRTKCILPIDLYGQIYDYDKVKILADKYGIKILEDACQSIGAEQDSKMAGTFGDAAAFSLYATKTITCGEGGIVTTDSLEIADKCRMFRHHGQSEQTRYEYWDIGYNYRLTDIQAAIALAQMDKINLFLDKRNSNAASFNNAFSGITGLIVPIAKPGNRHGYHQYTLRITNKFKSSREDFVEHLNGKGIRCGIYYPKPLHLHKHFTKMGYCAGDFPVAEKLSKEVVSLPIHPALSSDDVNFIIKTIVNYAR